MKYNIFYLFIAVLFIAPYISGCEKQSVSLSVSINELTVPVYLIDYFMLQRKGNLTEDVNLTFIQPDDNYIIILPRYVILNSSEIISVSTIQIEGRHPGRLTITAETVPQIAQDIFIKITVCYSESIYYLSIIFGWVYFVAWSISFYPQIITNFQRNSVVGLNFDFVLLNIVGFILYSIFNVCLYWVPAIQNEYFNRNPRGLNPVFANDIFFSLHAVFATIIIILQCFLYERQNQRVSYTALGILSIFAVVIITTVILAAANLIEWLDFLYYCSYIKLSITLIKYIPQAVMNSRRESTEGWSIGNILLDFIGGTLSMFQMILNAYNYDDWASIFGDPTKFGLGLFTVCFDIFFMLQHYVFYRNNQMYEEIPGTVSVSENERILSEDPTVSLDIQGIDICNLNLQTSHFDRLII